MVTRTSGFSPVKILSLLLITPLLSLAAATPAITSATFSSGANTLTIAGSNLQGASGSGARLVSINQVGSTQAIICALPSIMSQSTTSIVVNLAACNTNTSAAALAGGTYVLVVNFNDGGSAVFSYNSTVIAAVAQTNLIYPFVTNTGGQDTTIVISNVSATVATPVGSPGACQVALFSGGASPVIFDTPSIAGGAVFTTNVSTIAPGLGAGYGVVTCSFTAQGAEWVASNGGLTIVSVPVVKQ